MQFIHRLLNKIENAHSIYLITILIVVPLIIYFPSLFNSFVWDDEEQVVNNVFIQNLSNIPYLFTSSTFNTGGAGLSGFYYKPLMPLAFTFNFFIWKTNPFGFHFFDLIFHIINGILVCILFKKLFNPPAHSGLSPSGSKTGGQKFKYYKTFSFILSFLFVIHPANTESVAYISSTQELLYTFFLVLSLIFTINFLNKKRVSLKSLFFINLFILFSLLSKESGLVTIPLVIAFAFLFYRSKTAVIGISSFITFIFYLILRFAIAKTPVFQHSSIIPIANANFLDRVKTIPFELFSYIRLMFFPKDLFVAQHQVINNIYDSRFYISFVVALVFLFFLTFVFLKSRSKLYLFFLLWIIFSFSILLNIYALDMTVAERWLYGPMIGMLGLFGFFILDIIKKNEKMKNYILIFFLIIIPVLTIKTFIRTMDWKNNLTLFSHDERYVNDSFDLQNNLGVALFRNNDMKNAKKHFEKSVSLSPKWWTSYNNLGVIYQRDGNINMAKKLYEVSIKNGDYYLAYENLAEIKYKTEKPKDVLPFIESSLSRLPYNEVLNKIAAITYYQTGATESAKLYAQRTYLINKSQENYLLLQTVMNGK